MQFKAIEKDDNRSHTSDGSGESAGNSKDDEKLLTVPKLRRLRRCKSLSRAEEIVTEDEKQRRAQPDKP